MNAADRPDGRGPPCRRRRILWSLYATGRQYSRWVSCRRWDCPGCRRRKLAEVSVSLMACVGDEHVHAAMLPPAHADAARRSIRGAKVSTLRVTVVGGGLYLVCSDHSSGRGWRLERVRRTDVVAELAAWPHPRPNRVVWTGDWHAIPEVSQETEHVLLLHTFTSVDEMAERLSDAGIDVRLTAVPDAVRAAVRARDALTGGDVSSLIGE